MAGLSSESDLLCRCGVVVPRIPYFCETCRMLYLKYATGIVCREVPGPFTKHYDPPQFAQAPLPPQQQPRRHLASQFGHGVGVTATGLNTVTQPLQDPSSYRTQPQMEQSRSAARLPDTAGTSNELYHMQIGSLYSTFMSRQNTDLPLSSPPLAPTPWTSVYQPANASQSAQPQPQAQASVKSPHPFQPTFYSSLGTPSDTSSGPTKDSSLETDTADPQDATIPAKPADTEGSSSRGEWSNKLPTVPSPRRYVRAELMEIRTLIKDQLMLTSGLPSHFWNQTQSLDVLRPNAYLFRRLEEQIQSPRGAAPWVRPVEHRPVDAAFKLPIRPMGHFGGGPARHRQINA